MEAFYQFFVDAVAAGVTKKNHIGTDWGQWYNEVANGKAAMWHGGTWHFGRYFREGNEDFWGTVEFSLIPAGAKGAGRANTITHPLVYVITDQAEDSHEEIAAQLVKIASEPRLNALHAIQSNHLGISSQMSNIELYANDRWADEATTRLLPHANSQPNHVQYGAFSEAMWKGLEAAWTGTQSPADAVASVQAELTAVLAEDLGVRLGGSGANTGSWLLRAGDHVRLYGLIGADARGRQILSQVDAISWDRSDTLLRDGPTNHCTILIDDSGDRTILGTKRGTTEVAFPALDLGSLDTLYFAAARSVSDTTAQELADSPVPVVAQLGCANRLARCDIVVACLTSAPMGQFRSIW